MNDAAIEVLKGVYDSCLRGFNKRKEKSLWYLVITSTSNRVRRVITSSACSLNLTPPIAKLCGDGFLEEIEPGLFTITAEGILYVEERLSIDNSSLVNYINNKLMTKDRAISGRNRVVLLSLLAVRSFSELTCLSYVELEKELAFMSVLESSDDFLVRHNILTESVIKKLKKSNKSKTPISQVLGEIDKLPTSSKMLFVADGKKYYLKIVDKNNIRKSVTLLTKIILGSGVNYSLISELKNFCESIFVKYGYMFGDSQSRFEGLEVDYEIEAGMNDVI